MTIDKTWKVMNDLDQAFSQITTLTFLAEQLQEAADAQEKKKIVDASLALNAFIPIFVQNWDDKFHTAWKHVVTKTSQKNNE